MQLRLIVLPETFAICQIEAYKEIPSWAVTGNLYSVTRTSDEISIVCEESCDIPPGVRCERGWRIIRLAGNQSFTVSGILSSIIDPLAADKIGIFSISTYDTDYVLVKSEHLDRAIAALRFARHTVEVQEKVESK